MSWTFISLQESTVTQTNINEMNRLVIKYDPLPSQLLLWQHWAARPGCWWLYLLTTVLQSRAQLIFHFQRHRGNSLIQTGSKTEYKNCWKLLSAYISILRVFLQKRCLQADLSLFYHQGLIQYHIGCCFSKDICLKHYFLNTTKLTPLYWYFIYSFCIQVSEIREFLLCIAITCSTKV